MSSHFKVRLKELAWLIVQVFLTAATLYAQPQHLLPEKDFSTGLPDNVVRVIRHDAQHRIWAGTDKGLCILNSNEPALHLLQQSIGQSLVFSILFYKKYVLIGTWDNGLFVYDLEKQKINAHFQKELISRCRKMRVFHDTVYIASKPTGFLATLSNETWKLDSLKTPDHAATFIMDYFEWNKKIYAAQHMTVTYMYPIEGDSLLTNRTPFLKDKISTRAILSGMQSDSTLYLGTGNLYFKINRAYENSDSSNNLHADSVATEAIWDMLFLKNRKFMATGNANNLQGMVVEPDITGIEESLPDFYVLSLGRDETQQGLWYGVTEKGLYYWPLMEQSFHLPVGWQSEANLHISSTGELLMVKNNAFLKVKLEGNAFVPDGEPVILPFKTDIRFIEKTGDTLVLCTYEELYAKVGAKEYLIREPYKNYRGLFRNGTQVYTYFKYANFILNLNLKDGSVKTVPINYTVLKNTDHQQGKMLFSAGEGFIYFDTVSKPVKGFFPVADEYKMLGDTLWVLLGKELQSYLFHKKDSSLQKLTVWEFKSNFQTLIPKWLQVAGNELYLGSINGFFKIDTKTGQPQWFQYTGNAKSTVKPVSYSNQLYFHWDNYLAKITPVQPYAPHLLKAVKLEFSDSLEIMEKEPITLLFNTPDYFIREHCLKKIELWKDEELLTVNYCLDSSFQIRQGLSQGNYVLRVWMNGIKLQDFNFKVSIPILKNPAFYITFTLFFLIMTGFIVYGWMNQKGLQKRLLESRLQVLKQNLNPHFIFNSLNLIYGLVLQKKNDEAVKTIANFSDLHRYFLENVSKNKVTLQEELLFIESYLLLESERVHLDNPFEYHLPPNLDKIILGMYLPPMILQPLVENAVKYCHSIENNQAEIWLDVSDTKGGLLIGIENTTHYKNEVIPKGTGSGIALVKERVRLNNESMKTIIRLHENTPLKHCKEGYRIELFLKYP